MKLLKPLLLAMFPTLLLSCSNECKIYDYSDVTHIEWEHIFDIESDYYYIYVYSLSCGHCKDIKEEIINFAMKKDNETYFVLYNKDIPVVDSNYVLIGKTNYQDLGIVGTPTLFEISNHFVSDVCTGSESIIKTLTKHN